MQLLVELEISGRNIYYLIDYRSLDRNGRWVAVFEAAASEIFLHVLRSWDDWEKWLGKHKIWGEFHIFRDSRWKTSI